MEKVLAASSCLEGKDNMQGAASLVRKSKSLVQRWLAKPNKVKDSPLNDPGDILIKRDVVILVNMSKLVEELMPQMYPNRSVF